MAGKTKPMNTIKQMLIKMQHDESIKQIARDLMLSRNTIKRYKSFIQSNAYTLEQLIAMDDIELERLLNGKASVNKDHLTDLQSMFPWMAQQLKLTGVNRYVLWGEYKERYPQGYSYSQFCWHYQQWDKAQQVSMVIPHSPADKVYIDFAGKKLKYHDLQTDKEVAVEFFVAILGYSQYSFACAVETQNSADFIFACKQMLEYFEGSPKAIVCDNLKSGVTKADRYEPDVNRSFSDFCNHYQMAIVPTRVAKPKDKSLVEGLVRILYSRIYAPLRNQSFYSLEQINTAIKEQLLKHNQTPLTKSGNSRLEHYEKQEKTLLNPLPEKAFEIKYYKTATVQKNCHIILSQDKHYYSVPMRYIGKKVLVIYTSSSVHVYYEQQQIAYHARSRRMHQYTTVADHLPSQHQYLLGLSPEYFINWAKRIDADVARYIELLIQSKSHPEQSFKSCQGIQSLYRKLGAERLKQAVRKGLELEVYNYMFIKNIMERPPHPASPPMPVLPLHENIRGPEHYH
ncbi:MAG: IS21 family transposase [Bacteroidetes bacterium]|nr:IS21 family transposase [Bacteroidota bacterium]MBU2465862.1 IS21 family transposase [Bacteroidota bacterium]MBU2556246.1 IS21 family transposase [Bacteroidota bacterium]